MLGSSSQGLLSTSQWRDTALGNLFYLALLEQVGWTG